MDIDEMYVLFEQMETGTDLGKGGVKTITNSSAHKIFKAEPQKKDSPEKPWQPPSVRIEKIKDNLLRLAKRSSIWQAFSDWIEIMALMLSCYYDPSHYDERAEMLKKVGDQYSIDEIKLFLEAFIELCEIFTDNLKHGYFTDVLGSLYMELGLSSEPNGQYFSPDSICQMMGMMTIETADVSKKGYITISEPAAGSGAILLGQLSEAVRQGINPKTQAVVFAVDTDIRCVHMCYVQLSLYGVPAVVQHGNTLSLETWHRWYTPVYVMDDWVWRQRMALVDERNYEDERLKCILQPMYGIMVYGLRNLKNTIKQKERTECVDS